MERGNGYFASLSLFVEGEGCVTDGAGGLVSFAPSGIAAGADAGGITVCAGRGTGTGVATGPTLAIGKGTDPEETGIDGHVVDDEVKLAPEEAMGAAEVMLAWNDGEEGLTP